MLSAVLRSPVAMNVSIEIMRAFVEIRNHLAATGRLAVGVVGVRGRVRLRSCVPGWICCQRISLCSGGESDT
mgnify:CR=1 FL=1